MKRIAVLIAAVCSLAFAAPAFAGDFIYERCELDANLAICLSRLDAIDATMPDVNKILNYGTVNATNAQAAYYAATADANGQKIVWRIRDSWDAATTTAKVNTYKNYAGTWGYKIGEEGEDGNAAVVAAADPNHPRLYVDAACDACHTALARLQDHADDAEVLAGECYPVRSEPGPYGIDDCDQLAQNVWNIVHSSNSDSAHSTWMVLQAFSWSDAPPSGITGDYPTWWNECDMRDDTAATITGQIGWYSYEFMTSPYTVADGGHAPPNAADRLESVITDTHCDGIPGA